jgi:site-specific DNA-cytosine methylase
MHAMQSIRSNLRRACAAGRGHRGPGSFNHVPVRQGLHREAVLASIPATCTAALEPVDTSLHTPLGPAERDSVPHMGKAHGSESDTDEGAGPSKQSKATGNKANGNWGARAVTSGQDGKAKRSSKDTWKRYMGCAGVWHGHKCPAAPRGASKSADHRYDGIRVACPTQMQVLPTYRHSRNPCELRDKCLEAYLRPSLDLVAGTVTATVRVFLSNKNAYIHPFEDRTTTARELAGLQVRSWLSSKLLMS